MGRSYQELAREADTQSGPTRQVRQVVGYRIELYIKSPGLSRNLPSQFLFQSPQEAGQQEWNEFVGIPAMMVGIVIVLPLASRGSPNASYHGSSSHTH